MDPGRGHLRPAEIRDPPGAVGQALECGIVEGDHDAVGGEPGVGLQIPEPHVHRTLEGGEGVLRRLVTAAAVGEGQRPVM